MQLTIKNVSISFEVPELDTISSKLERLDSINQLLIAVLAQGVKIMAALDDLKTNVANLVASVAAEKTVVDSAVAALNGITAQLASLHQQLADAIAAGDPIAIQAAADAILAQNNEVIAATSALAAAIPANTTPPA
jgi:hypothetical protein